MIEQLNKLFPFIFVFIALTKSIFSSFIPFLESQFLLLSKIHPFFYILYSIFLYMQYQMFFYLLQRRQLNLMQTPYKILQLKQKQKKKLTSESLKQRSFTVTYTKNGHNSTQCFIQKNMFLDNNHKHNHQNTSHHHNQLTQHNNKIPNSGKKYEIIFRQSIRKANAQRVKVYQPHKNINKKETVLKFNSKLSKQQLISSKNLNQQPQCYPNNHQQSSSKNNKINSNPQQKYDTLSVGKYRILLKRNSQINHPKQQQFDQFQIVPQISVLKCKLNHYSNQKKQQISKIIKSLFNHNQKIINSQRKKSFSSCFTEEDQNQQEEKSKTINLNWFDENEFSLQETKTNFHSKTIEYNQYSKRTSKGRESRYQLDNETSETNDYKNIANFIKTKKKRKLPISIRNDSRIKKDFFEFKRTATDDFLNNNKRTVTMNVEDRYFSPNKKSRFGAKIKFNSIEDNISGWEIGPSQISNINNQQSTLKNHLNQQ